MKTVEKPSFTDTSFSRVVLWTAVVVVLPHTTPMPLASALQLVLNGFGVYTAADFVAILRHDSEQLADFVEREDVRAQLEASAGTAHVETQTDIGIPSGGRYGATYG